MKKVNKGISMYMQNDLVDIADLQQVYPLEGIGYIHGDNIHEW